MCQTLSSDFPRQVIAPQGDASGDPVVHFFHRSALTVVKGRRSNEAEEHQVVVQDFGILKCLGGMHERTATVCESHVGQLKSALNNGVQGCDRARSISSGHVAYSDVTLCPFGRLPNELQRGGGGGREVRDLRGPRGSPTSSSACEASAHLVTARKAYSVHVGLGVADREEARGCVHRGVNPRREFGDRHLA